MLEYSRRCRLYAPLLAALTLTPLETTSAAQCIWNKAGFVLKASWYDPDDIGTVQVTETVDGVIQIKNVLGVKENKTPVQVDQWPTAQGRFTRGPNASKVNSAARLSDRAWTEVKIDDC